MKRFLVIGILLPMMLLMALLSFAPKAQALQNNLLKLTVEAGYDGYFRANQWLPVLIKVSNNGTDISGKIRVSSGTTGSLAAPEYATDIDLPSQSAKQVVLNIQLLAPAGQVVVELVNDTGVLASASQNVKLIQPSDQLYGLVTESPRGAVDLSTAKSALGDTYQVNWHIENIPPTPQGLEGLDTLVLTDVDSGNLSEKQRQAVENWVISGGHLVVTGGPNWDKTQSGVSKLLPLAPNGTDTLTSLPSLAGFANGSTDKLTTDKPIIVSKGQLANDAQVLVQQSIYPLLVRHRVGQGFTDYLAIDPQYEPYSSWPDRGKFWAAIFTQSGLFPSWSNGVSQSGQAVNAADFIKGLRLPDVLQLILFLSGYILLIGPVNYFILSRIKRTEWAWLTIPLIIIGCSIFTYITGFSLRGTQATINRIALVQSWPGTQTARVDSVIGILAPRRAIYNIKVGNNFSLQTLQSDQPVFNPSTGLDPVAAGLSIVQNASYEARNVPVDAGTTATFSSTGYIKTHPIQGQATLKLGDVNSSAMTPQGIPAIVNGTVTNNSGQMLENCFVLVQGSGIDLGTLKAGESRDFNLTLSTFPASPAPGLPSVQSSYYNPNSYYDIQQEKTIQDIMGRTYTAQQRSVGNSLLEQEYWRRESFLRAIAVDAVPGGGRGIGVFFGGWTNTSPVDIELKDIASVTEDTTLYMYTVPVSVQTVTNDGQGIVTPSMMTWLPVDPSTLRGLAPYRLTLNQADKASFRFTPLVSLEGVSKIQLAVKTPPGIPGRSTISLKDWTNGQWVDLDTSVMTSSGNLVTQLFTVSKDVDHYVGPNNAVEIKVEPADRASYASFEGIDVTLYGKVAQAK